MSPELLETLARLFERSLQNGSPLLEQTWRNMGAPDGNAPKNGHGSNGNPGGSTVPGGATSLLDSLRTQQLLVEELVRIQTLLLRIVAGPLLHVISPSRGEANVAATSPVAPPPTPSSHGEQAPVVPPLPELPTAPPERDEDARWVDLLRGAERLLLLHPVAAQGAFSALIVEGRRFAATEPGQAMARALTGSTLLPKLRRVWEATTLNMLEERSTTVVPSMYVEAIFRMARSAGLEDILSAHHAERGEH